MADRFSDAEKLLVRMKVLEILDQCKGFPLRETALQTQLNLAVDGIVVTTDELGEFLEYLRSHAMVDFDVPPVGGPKRWRITDGGKQSYRDYKYQ